MLGIILEVLEDDWYLVEFPGGVVKKVKEEDLELDES